MFSLQAAADKPPAERRGHPNTYSRVIRRIFRILVGVHGEAHSSIRSAADAFLRTAGRPGPPSIEECTFRSRRQHIVAALSAGAVNRHFDRNFPPA